MLHAVSGSRQIVPVTGRTARTTEAVKQLDELLDKALAVDPNDGRARMAKGFLLAFVHIRYDEATVELERAIAVTPATSTLRFRSGPSTAPRGRKRSPSSFSTKPFD
jgi:Flp pilus assembly protein TadD